MLYADTASGGVSTHLGSHCDGFKPWQLKDLLSGKEGCGEGVSLGEVSKRLAKFVGREAGGMEKVDEEGREKGEKVLQAWCCLLAGGAGVYFREGFGGGEVARLKRNSGRFWREGGDGGAAAVLWTGVFPLGALAGRVGTAAAT